MMKFSETFEITMTLCRFFSLGPFIRKVPLNCICFNSLGRTTTFELSFYQNIHSFWIFYSTVFRIRILMVSDIFLYEVYRFQKTLQTTDAKKNTHYDYVQKTYIMSKLYGLSLHNIGLCPHNPYYVHINYDYVS